MVFLFHKLLGTQFIVKERQILEELNRENDIHGKTWSS